MRTLCACLDPLQPAPDREVDCLVITALEVEEFVISITTPVAPVDRVLAEQVEGAGHVGGAAAGHDEHDLFRHSLADHREEAAIEVSRSPFAVRGGEIEFEECIPMTGVQI